MTRDRDHWDREGGPGEVKGSKRQAMTGKVMTRGEVDAAENGLKNVLRRPDSKYIEPILTDFERLIATVRDREAEIERLSADLTASAKSASDSYTKAKQLDEAREQAEAERDRLSTAVQIAEDLLDIEMGPRSSEVVDRAWNVLHDALAPTEPGDAE